MEKQLIGKGLIIAVLGLGAFGLLAREPGRELTINTVFPERAAALGEGQEVAGGPRECDLQRGIDTACTFL